MHLMLKQHNQSKQKQKPQILILPVCTFIFSHVEWQNIRPWLDSMMFPWHSYENWVKIIY